MRLFLFLMSHVASIIRQRGAISSLHHVPKPSYSLPLSRLRMRQNEMPLDLPIVYICLLYPLPIRVPSRLKMRQTKGSWSTRRSFVFCAEDDGRSWQGEKDRLWSSTIRSRSQCAEKSSATAIFSGLVLETKIGIPTVRSHHVCKKSTIILCTRNLVIHFLGFADL